MSPSPPPPPVALSPQVRLVISLLLIIHLSCAAIGLLAATTPSRLVAELHSKALGFYTQTIGLDLNYDWNVAPLYLTQGSDLDVDSILEIELPASPNEKVDWDSSTRNTTRTTWPDAGAPGTDRRARYQHLAAYITRAAQNEQIASLLAQTVADRAMREQNVTEARVRVRRHLLQAIADLASNEEQQLDPYGANFYFTPANDEHYFEFQAQRAEDGEVIVVQVAAARDVAPVRSRPGGPKE